MKHTAASFGSSAATPIFERVRACQNSAKGKRLVRDASLTRGEIESLVGPNGAGKSSLLVALALGEGTASE